MKNNKKCIVVAIIMAVVLNSCVTTSDKAVKIPKDARPIYVSDVMVEGDFIEPAIAILSALDPEIDNNVISGMLTEINQDEDLVIYWVPSSNATLSNLSLQVGNLNGSFVFSKWSLQYASNSLKRMGRSSESADATEDKMENEASFLSDEDLKALEAKKDSFSEEERKELKKSLIYLTTASTSMVNVPVVSIEIIEQLADIIKSPKQLSQNPLEVPRLVGQAKSINDNIVNISKEAPDVIKNMSAVITVLNKILG